MSPLQPQHPMLLRPGQDGGGIDTHNLALRQPTWTAAILGVHLRGRQAGLVFRRRRWQDACCTLEACNRTALEKELGGGSPKGEVETGQPLGRAERGRLARRLWAELGAVKEDHVRIEFMRLTRLIGLPGCTAPKMRRRAGDPLIRNELMGHVAMGQRSAGHGLAMTAVYTHSRPETRRQQLAEALASRPALAVARAWLAHRSR